MDDVKPCRHTAEELRENLRTGTADEPRAPLGTRLAAHFAGIGLSEDIPELRGNSVRPAELDE